MLIKKLVITQQQNSQNKTIDIKVNIKIKKNISHVNKRSQTTKKLKIIT